MPSSELPKAKRVRLSESRRCPITMYVVAILIVSTFFPSAGRGLEGADTCSISQRIGADIDAEERDYFGLFPALDGFVEARTYAAPGDTTLVVAHWERQGVGGDSTITLGLATAVELRRYIEEVEHVIEGKLTIRWDIIYQLAQLPARDLDRKGKATKVITAAGRELSGELIFASSDVLIISQGGHGFCWDSAGTCVKAMGPSEIKQVRITTGTNFWASVGVGAGGGVLLGLALVGKLAEADTTGDIGGDDYLLGMGILGGIGLVGGLVYGAARGSEDTYDVFSDPNRYATHLNEIRAKAFFRDVAPPEFRQYSRAGAVK
jgi:hypothetical protein